MAEVVVATKGGIHRFDTVSGDEGRGEELAGRAVDALAREGSGWWAIAGERGVVTSQAPGHWDAVAHVPLAGTCVAPAPGGLLVGTEGASLFRFTGGGFEPVESFERVEGRGKWYTPWGGPPATRSMSVGPDGAVYVNVHVGGVLRSADEGHSWEPTIDIDTDVHQVLADPSEPARVFAAAAVGLAVTDDGGASWRYETNGLHATYARAVAIADGVVLVSVSRGPGGHQAALYRRPLGGGSFERCRDGLPEWFESNIDTACLAAEGPVAAFGTEEGSVFLSEDGGATWRLLADDLPAVRSIGVA
jgi:hypothetical protein